LAHDFVLRRVPPRAITNQTGLVARQVRTWRPSTRSAFGFDKHRRPAPAATFSRRQRPGLTVNQDPVWGNNNGIRVSCYYTADSKSPTPHLRAAKRLHLPHLRFSAITSFSGISNSHAAFLIVDQPGTTAVPAPFGASHRPMRNRAITITFATLRNDSGLPAVLWFIPTSPETLAGPVRRVWRWMGNLAYRVFRAGALVLTANIFRPYQFGTAR